MRQDTLHAIERTARRMQMELQDLCQRIQDGPRPTDEALLENLILCHERSAKIEQGMIDIQRKLRDVID